MAFGIDKTIPSILPYILHYKYYAKEEYHTFTYSSFRQICYKGNAIEKEKSIFMFQFQKLSASLVKFVI